MANPLTRDQLKDAWFVNIFGDDRTWDGAEQSKLIAITPELESFAENMRNDERYYWNHSEEVEHCTFDLGELVEWAIDHTCWAQQTTARYAKTKV